MVLCAIFGCGTRTVRDKGVYMARIPSVVTNQGEETRILSEERRKKWISAISRKDLTDSILEHGRVCDRHFISGKAAKQWDRYDSDWIPIQNLGHNKCDAAEKLQADLEAAGKRDERVRDREMKSIAAENEMRLREEIEAIVSCKLKQTEKKNNNVTKENKMLPISIFCAHYSQQMGFVLLSKRYLWCYASAY